MKQDKLSLILICLAHGSFTDLIDKLSTDDLALVLKFLYDETKYDYASLVHFHKRIRHAFTGQVIDYD